MLTDKEAKTQIEQKEECCDGCGRTTDDLVKCWDEKLCPECYRQYKENERINAKEKE